MSKTRALVALLVASVFACFAATAVAANVEALSKVLDALASGAAKAE